MHSRYTSIKRLDYFTFIPKTLLKILLIIPITILMSTVPLALCLSILSLMSLLFMPLILLYPVASLKGNARCMAILGLICFYPLIGMFMMLMSWIGIGLYPILRRSYHHGVYDPFDKAVVTVANKYL